MQFTLTTVAAVLMLLAAAHPTHSGTSTEGGVAAQPQASRLTKPSQAVLHLQKANEHLGRREFDQAIDFFTRALRHDDTLDEAYFGRGMALGSSGLFDEGIRDLSVYLSRHPNSSRAYTKRGIRYLWKGASENAYQDFQKAIALDPGNAEAYDDIGVIFAQRQDFKQALESFRTVIRLEPLYFKAHHNMAMVYQLLGDSEAALVEVNNALLLKADSRSSMRLKGVILEGLGRHKEAREVSEEAEFMPEENWSEVAPLR